MPALVRLLLIWLLALALPAQGIAAATMQFCGPGHHPQAPAAMDAAAHHGHGSAQAQPEAHAAMHADMHHADPDSTSASTNDLAQHGQLKCSACAACCAGSALPPAGLTLPIVEPAIELPVAVRAAYVGPDAVGLERPPKHPLA